MEVYIDKDCREISDDLVKEFYTVARLWHDYCTIQSRLSYNHIEALTTMDKNPSQLVSDDDNVFKTHVNNSIQQYNYFIDIQQRLFKHSSLLLKNVNDSVTVKPYTNQTYMWIYNAASLTFMPFDLTNWPKTESGAYMLGGFPTDYYFFFDNKWLNF